jgi:hypothetical protein
MTTTPARRTAARDELGRAMASRRHAFVVHYACEGFEKPDRRVTAIAARNLGTGATTCFDLETELRCAGIDPAKATDADLNRHERKMLGSFYAFVRKHPDHFWLHWNMRDTTFGFPALQNRQKALGGRVAPIAEQYRVDLASRMIDLHGDNYADPKRRLADLAGHNGLASNYLIDGAAQAERLEDRDFASVTRSLVNRLDILYAIATKANEGTLKTRAPWRDRVAAAGGATKLVREHPLALAFVILAPIVTVVAGGLRIWTMLHG